LSTTGPDLKSLSMTTCCWVADIRHTVCVYAWATKSANVLLNRCDGSDNKIKRWSIFRYLGVYRSRAYDLGV